LLDQLEQSGIVQELIDGVEQIVFEQRRLQGQGRVASIKGLGPVFCNTL
jgi:hypothetical protein